MTEQFAHALKPSDLPAQEPARRDPDAIARAYLKSLAAAERTTSFVDDDLAELDDGATPSSTQSRIRSTLRADVAALAVLVGRAIQSEPGLARRLRQESPVVTLATHVDDVLPLVQSVIRKAVFPPSTCFDSLSPSSPERPYVYLLVQDVEETQATRAANMKKDIAKALNYAMPIVGVAPRPNRHLPSDLVRAADHQLSLPALDASAIALVMEAVFGEPPTFPIPDAVAHLTDPVDLQIAFRTARMPDEAAARLADVVSRKRKLADGPRLSQLDGYGPAKDWGMECAADLADLRAGRLTWDDVDHKGLLLCGPPGTGKTQFAKALAAEAAVPLVATSVAQWNAAAYLSGTLSAIRKSFAEAQRKAPCVLFIDEMDGIGDRENFSEYRDYWAQIVNCLLEELAGVVEREGVVVVAATNHPDKIDAAVRRAGRLDRTITLAKPDLEALKKIFRFHLGKDLADADLTPLALSARGSTGADVEAWVRRARGAARRARQALTLERLLDTVSDGASVSPHLLRHTAIHEAGHGVAAIRLGRSDVQGLGLKAGGGGQTELANSVTTGANAGEVDDMIVLLLCGRAAEEMVLGSGTAGAYQDLSEATRFALLAETRFGFGALGPMSLLSSDSERLLMFPEVREAVFGRIDACRKRASALMAANRPQVLAVANTLEQTGYVSGDDLKAIIARVDEAGDLKGVAVGAAS
jgi:hypothetical protein